PDAIAALARERDALRAAGDYAGADALRERIRAGGYEVIDTGKGTARLVKRAGGTFLQRGDIPGSDPGRREGVSSDCGKECPPPRKSPSDAGGA
ncbi:MAG: hypothetical protein WBM29_01825, partial [Candidatus Deferrimicrobium sp.]